MSASRWRVALAAAAVMVAALCVWNARRGRQLGAAALTPFAARAQADVHFGRAREAYTRHDFALFLAESRAALALVPGSARALYNVACGAALGGHESEALAALGTLADWGVDVGAARDSDLASLRGQPAFEALLQRFAALHEPLGQGRVAFTLPEKGLIPEGLAYDPQTRAFFVSSVHRRKIVRVTADGVARDFIASGRDGLLAALALRADPARRALWACSSGVREMQAFRPEDAGRAALFEFDLDSGALRRRLEAPDAAARRERNFNDLALDAGGTLYLSDAAAGELLRLPPGGERLELFVERGTFRSPQGLALVDGGLYVADYALGLARVDLATRAVTFLDAPSQTLLAGIDGLVSAGGRLIAIQNGLEPARVVSLELDASGRRVTVARVLERAHALFDEPTLGVVVDGELYYVANSQWGRVDAQGQPGPTEALRDPTVLRLPL